MKNRLLFGTVAISAVASLLAACASGASNPPDNNGAGSAPATAAAATASPTPSIPAVTLPHKAVFKMKSANDYAITATLWQGELMPAAHGRVNGESRLGNGCPGDVDDDTDAALPIRLELTNTSAMNFSPAVELVPRPLKEYSPVEIFSEVAYTQGPACRTEQGSSGFATIELASNDKMLPGATIHMDGWLVFRHYYSPAHPKQPGGGGGDVMALQDTVIAIQGYLTQSGTPDDVLKVVSAEGEGTQLNAFYWPTWGVPIPPSKGSGSCLVTGTCKQNQGWLIQG